MFRKMVRRIKLRGRYLINLTKHHFGPAPNADSLDQFLNRASTIVRPRVLELGTKRTFAERSTRHDHWITHASEYFGTDIGRAEDVDQAADVHKLSDAFGEESFDVIISCSTFEHFKYPFLAAHEVMKTLRIGGILFIQTHQSYPIHAAPSDYFRFSREAISALFGTRMGFRVISTDYQFPARLNARQDRDLRYFPSFLNVQLFGEKISKTPPEFIYELDA